MMQKIQKFGGAMFTPVLLFAFAGIVIGLGTLFTTEVVFGALAAEGTTWYKVWNVVLQGGWTVFNQLPLLFVVALPIGLAKKQNARCCMEALVLYLTFNYFVSAILAGWGTNLGIDFAAEASNANGLTMIANIKTLDMGMIGALMISGVVIFLHNRYYDTELPEWLGVFNGSTFVFMVGFFVMIPVAILAVLVWPKVQMGMAFFQGFVLNAGAAGVGVFVFLERILIPFGLHHLLYSPFYYDNVVVNGGIYAYWAQHLPEIAASTVPLMANHGGQFLIMLLVGLCFTGVWFVVFRFLILKFNYLTPGREEEVDEIKFYSKQEYRDAKGGNAGELPQKIDKNDKRAVLAMNVLEGLGGKDNIVDVTNCATRLRVNVVDETLVVDDKTFKAMGTMGASKNGQSIQVIIGLTVPKLREKFEELL